MSNAATARILIKDQTVVCPYQEIQHSSMITAKKILHLQLLLFNDIEIY